MRIVHVTGYFSESMEYQENLLPVGQVELGHTVFILTGRKEAEFDFNKKNRDKGVIEFDYKGVRVYRLDDYFEFKNKGPILKGLIKKIWNLKPDVLFIHGIGSALCVGLIYKILNNKVRLQIDIHSTESNSLKSLIGPTYHNVFKLFFKIYKNKFDKLFAIAPECAVFMQKYYGLKESEITHLPLPGDNSFMLKADSIRENFRKKIGLKDDELVVLHAGKLSKDKKTEQILRNFEKINNKKLRLVLAGTADPDLISVINAILAKDSRVIYLGWLSADELREVFFGSDLLVQPGSLSNVFISAICCGLPILVGETLQGIDITSHGNGGTIPNAKINQLDEVISEYLEPLKQKEMKRAAIHMAEYYGYNNIAKLSLQ